MRTIIFFLAILFTYSASNAQNASPNYTEASQHLIKAGRLANTSMAMSAIGLGLIFITPFIDSDATPPLLMFGGASCAISVLVHIASNTEITRAGRSMSGLSAKATGLVYTF